MDYPIRVLHVIGIMNRGGAEAMIMNLYRNIDKSKVQFDFVENSFEPAAFDEEIEALGGKIYRCPHFNGKNYLQYRKWWSDFFREHKNEYRIIHGHIGSCAAIYLHEAKKVGLYAIAHSHSSGTDHSMESYLYSIVSYPTRYIADYFFACSRVAGEDRYGKKVAKSQKCKVLNNAVNTNDFKFDQCIRESVRSKFAFDNKFVIGHIGRFVGVKNHAFIIDIFSEVKIRIPNAILLLVGDGPLKGEIVQKVNTMGLQDSVIFTGVRSDVNQLIQSMDIFVFPSLFEGLPVTLVETQTAGLPCIISDKVPTESIITDELVTVMKLSDSPKTWAEHIIKRLNERRFDRSQEVIDAGYDIVSTAKWLEEFYLEKSRGD